LDTGNKAMEVLLTLAQQQGKQFCTGLPLAPTLKGVPSLLAKERRLDAAALGVPARRNRYTIKDAPMWASAIPPIRCTGCTRTTLQIVF
jgi:hypothetical protein